MSTALAADLSALTAALGVPGTDLGGLLAGLSQRLARAAPSCVGLRMTVVVDGCPITLGTVPAGVRVASSMRMPLRALAPVGPGGERRGGVVVFYATTAGALVDLAADLDYALGGRRLAVLDDDLSPDVVPPGVGGLEDLSTVNRAIGLQIDGGCTPVEAMVELDRYAGRAGVSRIAAAHLMVAPWGRA